MGGERGGYAKSGDISDSLTELETQLVRFSRSKRRLNWIASSARNQRYIIVKSAFSSIEDVNRSMAHVEMGDQSYRLSESPEVKPASPTFTNRRIPISLRGSLILVGLRTICARSARSRPDGALSATDRSNWQPFARTFRGIGEFTLTSVHISFR